MVTALVAGQDVGAVMLAASEALDTEYTEQVNARPPAGGCVFTVRNTCKTNQTDRFKLTSTKGTINPEGACLLTYSVLYAYAKPCLCINIQLFITTLHQLVPPLRKLQAAQCIELQPHWLQHAAAVLVKVQCQVLNRQHETNFANYSIIRK